MSDRSRVSAAWTDNMPLDTLNAATQLNSSAVASMRADHDERFWSTPNRRGDSDTSEAMEITLSDIRLVNHLTLDLVKFPHDCDLEYFDEDRRDWYAFMESDRDDPCRREVVECYPEVLPPVSMIDGHEHPQHSYSGHWESHEFHCKPVRFRRCRVVLKRHTRSKLPRNAFGELIEFSLAIRNFYCGYKVFDRDSVPRPQPVLTSYTEHADFASTTDLLGSAVNYSIRVNSASNVLLNDPNSTSNAAQTLIWRSEPQPFPWAVVNYFVDARDASGGAQVLDRFFLDPVTSGANVNLYYSNDEPDSTFKAADDPLPPQVAVINGQTSGPPLTSDTQPYGRVTFVDVDNTELCFVPGRRWWHGGHLNWKFVRSIDTHEHPIFDCGVFHLAWTSRGLRFRSRYGDEFYVDTDEFNPAHDFHYMCWYDGERVSLRIRLNGQDYHGEKVLTVPLDAVTVAKLRFGGFFSDATVSADFKLRHMCLKIDEDVVEDLIENFFTDPEPYCVRSEFARDDDGRTDNSIIRYHPSFVTPDFPSGFHGGGPTRYSSMQWSPIARDYKLARGYLYFSPTKAKYWKFEFCNLVPEPYEVYVPIKKTVKTYSTQMWKFPPLSDRLEDALERVFPGGLSSIKLGGTLQFSDSIGGTFGSGTSATAKGYTNTTVRVITDTAAAAKLSSVSWAWSFTPAHGDTWCPRFETTSVHTYDYVAVEQTTKVAYFVGLQSIAAYRVDYLSVDDTEQYVELFHDMTNIDTESGWVLTADHQLTSGTTNFAQVQSKVMPSQRIVRAVQFATTQSAPRQLLADDDFDDPAHTRWASVGDGALAPFTTQDVAVGSVLRVDRSSRNPSWSALPGLFPQWHNFDDTGASFLTVEQSGNPSQGFGGVESVAVSTPPGGRMYAAARVIAPAALSSPLYVQIVDSVSGQVLSETASDVQANQITEWWTSYTVGDGTQIQAWRWRDFSTSVTYPVYVDNFSRANSTGLGSLITNQVWLNGGLSHDIVSNQAVTTTAGDYDYVDGLTPWGTFEMVVGAMGTGAAAALLHFGPFRVDDQGVLTLIGGASSLPTTSVFGRAVAANDDLRIDILPTQFVPAGKTDTSVPDVVSAPYSLMFYLNGVWVKTIAHRLGARTLKGFLGRLNQQFKNFNWTPFNYGQLPAATLAYLPVAAYSGSWDAAHLTWTDVDNNLWPLLGSADNSTVPATLVFTAAKSKMTTDTKYWYGTLGAWVHHVAHGDSTAPGKHGYVLVLDDAAKIYLDYAGNVVQDQGAGGTVSFGNLIPGGVTSASHVSIQFLDTKSVASSIRGAIDPVQFPRMLVARVNASVVGTLGTSFVQTWTGTRRGLAGDAFIGVTGAMNANTTFEVDTANWTAIGGTIARSTAQFHGGTASLQLTPDGTSSLARPESERLPVVPGASYSTSSWAFSTVAYSTSGGVVTRINWFDAAGTYISSTSSTAATLAANTWTNLTVTGTAPANAATANINPVVMQGVAAATNIVYVDDAVLTGNIADYNTSFRSFSWAPDASNVVASPANPTWNEVSQKGTGTYDSIAHNLTLTPGQLKARVVQKTPSIDVWDMDTLSMFADPVVWSFSNDGGLNFYNAFDVRNNPYGVLMFPEGVTVTASSGAPSQGSNPGQALIWRAVSYAPNSTISSLTIRPWYGGILSGFTHRTGVAAGGPNVMPYDHFSPIEQDARFQTWNKPVPQDWFYQFRILSRSKDKVLPPPTVLLLADAIESKYKDES